MIEPTVVELIVAALALVALVVAAWKASTWLTRRGHIVRPLTMMDWHMTRIEKQAAKNRLERASDSGGGEKS